MTGDRHRDTVARSVSLNQVWILIGCVLISGWLAVLLGCSAETPSSPPRSSFTSAAEPGLLDPVKLYRQARCDRCHGADRQGSAMAPPLLQLGQFWSEDGLTAYLADPTGSEENAARLETLTARYRLVMPSFKVLSEEERRALAQYLIAE